MVEINAYSRSLEGSRRLSAHFRVQEFACHCGADTVLVAPRLVLILEHVRARFRQPVTVLSGYRTPEYNTKIGGAPRSRHTCGMAADIAVKNVKPETVAAFIRQLLPESGGVGVYKTFVHVDVREEKADWKG